MKKISYLVIAGVISLFYLACSSEEAVQTTKPNSSILRLADPDVSTAKGLYTDMIASTEYADFKSSLRAFNLKLKNHNVVFYKKSDWMNWINDSITITDFTDKVEFETMYDDMSDKLDNLMKDNDDLFDYLAEADADQIGAIFAPGRPDVPEYSNTVSQTCLDNCISICDGAIDDNEADQDLGLAVAASLPASEQLGYVLGVLEKHDNRFLEIAMEFDACASQCPEE